MAIGRVAIGRRGSVRLRRNRRVRRSGRYSAGLRQVPGGLPGTVVSESRRRKPGQGQGDQYFVSHSFFPQKLYGTRFRGRQQVPKVTR
jgi:hypothetical protein